MTDRMKIDEVSAIIGESPHQIRFKCKRDMYDPPICRKTKLPGGKQYRYQFFRGMVMKYVGLQLEEDRQ